MLKVYQSFLAMVAASTEKELARQLQYLKTENRILRDKLPRCVRLTEKEKRRLIRFGKPLGSAIRQLITIVSPRTFTRWLSEAKPAAKPKRKPGRPKTLDQIREIILKLAGENGWGLTRILGELKKLGLKVGRSTVKRILAEGGFDSGPDRSEGSWTEFVTRHAKTLWACDFFSVKTMTSRGIVELYVLFFIQHGSRKVHLAGITSNPTQEWTTQQARNFFLDRADKPTHLIRDLDTKFSAAFERLFESEGCEVVKVGPKKPNMNAIAERFVQTVRRELLDHFIVFGEKHLRHLVDELLAHYHELRPHQGKDIGNMPLSGTLPMVDNAGFDAAKVTCDERLGGFTEVVSPGGLKNWKFRSLIPRRSSAPIDAHQL